MLRVKSEDVFLPCLRGNMHPQHTMSGPPPCSRDRSFMLEHCRLVTYIYC